MGSGCKCVGVDPEGCGWDSGGICHRNSETKDFYSSIGTRLSIGSNKYNTTILRIRLAPWSSTRGDLAPQGASASVWDHFWLSQLGGGHYWPLVGRPGMLQNISARKNCSVHNVTSAETEKPCPELLLFQK